MDPRWQQLIDGYRRGVIPLSNLVDYRYSIAHREKFRARRSALRDLARLIHGIMLNCYYIREGRVPIRSKFNRIDWPFVLTTVLIDVVMWPFSILFLVLTCDWDFREKLFRSQLDLVRNRRELPALERHFREFDSTERERIISELQQPR